MVTVDSWLSPAAAGEDIVNIATGVVASDEVARDLVAAKAVGEAAFQCFVKERIVSSEVGFFEKIPKNKLNTFAGIVKSTKVVSKERAIVLGAYRALFARMLVIAQRRRMNMRLVLQYDLGP